MYLRRTTRRVGDKTYQNYLLVESVATPKGPRQRVICSLGALAPGPKDTWLGTARRLQAAPAPPRPGPHDRSRPCHVRRRTGSRAGARGASDVASAAAGHDPRRRRVESARAAPERRGDAEPVGAAGRGTRHARLDPAHR